MDVDSRSAKPYGAVWGLGTGLGVKIPVRQVALELEVRAHAILSDYRNSDFEASYFYPMRVGLRF